VGAINLEYMGPWLAAFIDQLPTEAIYRGQTINLRIGEAPNARQFLIAGIMERAAQGIEALIKSEDTGTTAPTLGETLTINSTGYKIDSVTALLSLTDPPAYRLIFSRIV
jgi:hypothetical protein